MDSRTKEILKRFKESWDQTEARYDGLIESDEWWGRLIPIRAFISKIKGEGYAEHFRLGTSMHALLLSRSINFGLRIEQKYIKIELIDVNDFEVTLQEGDKIYRQYRLKDLNDERVSKLLKTLKSTLVD